MFGISYCKAWAAAVSARLWTLCRSYGKMDARKTMRRIKEWYHFTIVKDVGGFA